MPEEHTTKPNEAISKCDWKIAVVLSIFTGPVAQMYCGRLRRAILWECIAWCLVLICIGILCYSSLGISGVIVCLMIAASLKLLMLMDAVFLATNQSPRPRKSYQKVWIYMLSFFLFASADYGLATLLKTFWVEAFSLPTRSMQNTIMAGDRILSDKIAVQFFELEHNQLVIFIHPESQENYVKRLIGLPGDTIELRENVLYRNGKQVAEPYVHFDQEEYQKLAENNFDLKATTDFGPLTVPENELFLLGDNRFVSYDSRYHGTVPKENVFAIAKIVYWSREVPPNQQGRDFREMEEAKEVQVIPTIRWNRIGIRLDQYSR